MSAGWYEGRLARDAMATLDEAGITLRLGEDGRIHAGPASKLTSALRQLITEHKDGMALELSPPRERELRLRVNKLESDLAFEKNTREIFEGLSTAAMAQLRQRAETIPTDIRKALVILCHPDRHPTSRQPAANKAMTWLNSIGKA